MVGSDGLNLATDQCPPERVSIRGRPQWWLAEVLAGVRLGKALLRQEEVEGTRLHPQRDATRPTFLHFLQSGLAGEVDDVGGGASLFSERYRPRCRRDLRANHPRLRVV